MPDDVLMPLTGDGDATAKVATDLVGDAHHQRVKVDLGGDGASSPLVRGQQTAANSLPVVLASDQAALSVSDPGASGVSLNAATVAADGADVSFSSIVRETHAMQVVITGAPSAVVVDFQLFVGAWVTVATWNLTERASGDILFASGLPGLKARAKLVTLTGGTVPTVTATIASK